MANRHFIPLSLQGPDGTVYTGTEEELVRQTGLSKGAIYRLRNEKVFETKGFRKADMSKPTPSKTKSIRLRAYAYPEMVLLENKFFPAVSGAESYTKTIYKTDIPSSFQKDGNAFVVKDGKMLVFTIQYV